ncbi:hypothetical protein [Agromyces ramosus]|uniref:Uncharacterized protein n=1 Tax=Agromyces ramosus TaxID=33879 RepID=A0ABU0R9K8_9MICO|nr:hypothetical protein [Agromyces ramosus]MDQ0894755.1 hypothetical protein [Agromyces ramosus]
MTNHTSSDVPGTTVPDTQSGIQTGTPVGTQTGTPVGGKPPLKDEAATVAADAGDAGRRVMDVAKDETKGVAEETRHQVRRLTDEVGSELRQQAATQQVRVAQGLRSAGSEFSQMAQGSTNSGYATELVRAAGNKADSVAQWLDARDPGSLLQEVKGFARRRPGVFIAIAVGAGIVAGRLTRALTAPEDTSGTAASGTGSRPVGLTTSGLGASGSTVPTGDTWVPASPGVAGDRYTETPSVEASEYPDANEYPETTEFPEGGGRR